MGDYPIPEHPTWFKVDSTKLQSTMDCWRMYMYEYIFGWRSSRPNNHLVFGDAWHAAMEHLLIHGYSDLEVIRAYDKFLKKYRLEFSEDTDSEFAPKTPHNALNALSKYVEHYKSDMEKYKVLYTETSGVVSLAEDIQMYFKIDSILEDNDKMIFSLEHKTGSMLSDKWKERFSLSTQVGTYTHVMYCMYPPERVKGVKINGAFFYKSKPPAFERVPVWKTKNQMQVWLYNTMWWIDELKHNMELLKEQTEDQQVLECFPMNTESCTKYFGCPYLDFCTAWPNPLQHYGEPPLGFKEDFWDPERETTHKFVDKGSRGEKKDAN